MRAEDRIILIGSNTAVRISVFPDASVYSMTKGGPKPDLVRGAAIGSRSSGHYCSTMSSLVRQRRTECATRRKRVKTLISHRPMAECSRDAGFCLDLASNKLGSLQAPASQIDGRYVA